MRTVAEQVVRTPCLLCGKDVIPAYMAEGPTVFLEPEPVAGGSFRFRNLFGLVLTDPPHLRGDDGQHHARHMCRPVTRHYT